ncbi:MAG: FGGY-family carbohydrate kinase, partial [Acidimicrobiales bacterium]
RHVETNWALESGLYELDGGPAGPVLEAGGLDGSLRGPVRRPGEVVGGVSAAAAEATSLAAGTPVHVGGADHVLAAYAAGLASAGDWLVKLGGAGDILVVTGTPAIDRRWYLDAHPAPGLWLPNGCMATSGSLLRWAQQLFGGTELGVLDAEAAAAGPAELVCLPYFLGEKSPLHDPDLRGTFVGLHLGHGRGDVFRSCMEAVAYGFRDHVDAFGSGGVRLGGARVSNGGSGSTVWKQIVADVLGTELVPVVDHGGASLGAALVAAVGSGALDGWDGAAAHVRLGPPVVPDADRHRAYEDGYATFRELQRTLAPASHALAARHRA